MRKINGICVSNRDGAAASSRTQLFPDCNGSVTRYRFDLGARGAGSNVRIVTGLKIDPEFRRRPEIAPQTKRCVGRDAAASVHDIVQPRARNLDCPGKPVRAESHWSQEFIAQDFAGMNQRQQPPRSHIREIDIPSIHILTFDDHAHSTPLMVIDDLDLPCAAVPPNETDTPPFVDANAVLSSAVSPQRLKPVTRRRLQIVKSACSLKRQEFCP